MMFVDSTPQPCPRCLRPTVLVTSRSGRQWVHTNVWKPECEAPTALTAAAVSSALQPPELAA
jgi:hypothetical protein